MKVIGQQMVERGNLANCFIVCIAKRPAGLSVFLFSEPPTAEFLTKSQVKHSTLKVHCTVSRPSPFPCQPFMGSL